jgi:hypothetical protein
MTKIQFTKQEQDLLNKGSKFNARLPPKTCIKQLIYETENAIRQINDTSQQEAVKIFGNKKHTTNYFKPPYIK